MKEAPPSHSFSSYSREFQSALDESSRGLIDREIFIKLIAIAALAGEHVLAIGPDGTGKKEAVRRFAQSLGANYFEYLISTTTKPEELFGYYKQQNLQEELQERRLSGYMQGAEVAFLDELFFGSSSIINPLMGVLFERILKQGRNQKKCPLRVCVGATSYLPRDESLLAFANQFLIRVFFDFLPGQKLENLLEGGLWLEGWGVRKQSSMNTLERLSQKVKKISVEQIKLQLASLIRFFRKEGLFLSDRSIVKLQRLIAAATVLAGREEVLLLDLWPLPFLFSTKESQKISTQILNHFLQENSKKNQDLDNKALWQYTS